MSKNVVVVGAQWGDEGKGKVVDWLTERVDAREALGLLRAAVTMPVTPS